MPKKKLIEVALPLEAINAQSAREKSIRHGKSGDIADWAIIAPVLDSSYRRVIDGTEVSIMERRRREDRPGFAGSERRHRAALEVIAQKKDREVEAGPTAASLSAPTRGAILLTFSIDPEVLPSERREDGSGRVEASRVKRANWPQNVTASDVATLLSIALPYNAAPRGRIGFRVRRGDLGERAIVDLE